MTTNDETYNGWKNRETWIVNMYTSDAEWFHETANDSDRTLRELEVAFYDEIAESVREIIEDDMLVTDLVRCALDSVDLIEIIEGMREPE